MKLVRIAAILLGTVGTVCGAPPNPLIGKWKLAPPPADATRFYASCATSMAFTDKTQTLTFDGKATTDKVTYSGPEKAVYPATVYVIGNATHTTYLFSSKDKMMLDTGASCSYQRE